MAVKARKIRESRAERPTLPREKISESTGAPSGLPCAACGSWCRPDRSVERDDSDLLCGACSIQAAAGVLVYVDGEWKVPEMPSLAAQFREQLGPPAAEVLSSFTPTGIAAIDPEARVGETKSTTEITEPRREKQNQKSSSVPPVLRGESPSSRKPKPGVAPPVVGGGRRLKIDDWKITIDPEFRDLLNPLDEIALQRLRSDLLAHGCLDPLIVWRCTGHLAALGDTHPSRRVLLDGHHRYEICFEHRIPVEIVELEFASRAKALAWMRDHQVGRRNLTLEERNELIAKDYAAELARRKNGQKNPGEKNGKAAAIIADKHDVSAATVKRAVQADKAREKIALIAGRAKHELPAMTDDEAKMLATAAPFQVRDAVRRGTTAVEKLVKAVKSSRAKIVETIKLPLPKATKCSVSFELLEREDGFWHCLEQSKNAGGGGTSSHISSAAFAGNKWYRNRDACLQAAAESLEAIAVAQGKNYWPPAALKVIRDWRASLPQAGQTKKELPRSREGAKKTKDGQAGDLTAELRSTVRRLVLTLDDRDQRNAADVIRLEAQAIIEEIDTPSKKKQSKPRPR